LTKGFTFVDVRRLKSTYFDKDAHVPCPDFDCAHDVHRHTPRCKNRVYSKAHLRHETYTWQIIALGYLIKAYDQYQKYWSLRLFQTCITLGRKEIDKTTRIMLIDHLKTLNFIPCFSGVSPSISKFRGFKNLERRKLLRLLVRINYANVERFYFFWCMWKKLLSVSSRKIALLNIFVMRTYAPSSKVYWKPLKGRKRLLVLEFSYAVTWRVTLPIVLDVEFPSIASIFKMYSGSATIILHSSLISTPDSPNKSLNSTIQSIWNSMHNHS